MSGIAFVFPGQGAQAVGMGRDLYEKSPAARAVFDSVDAACGFSVTDLCFNGPEESLKETRYTQPALYATSVAALAACREAGIEPAAAAGHSIGEYAALTAAGALSVETGAGLVKARGEAMAEAAATASQPGSMAAVLGLDAAVVAECCREANPVGVVCVANYNAPGQIVISGEAPAVSAAVDLCKARGAKRAVLLAVSGAFHSPMMERASVVMRAVLQSAEISDPAVPVVANVTADYARTAQEIRHNLAVQVAGPVRWIESIERLAADGYDTMIECGPGTVLAGLIKRIAPGVRVLSVGDTAALAAARTALEGDK